MTTKHEDDSQGPRKQSLTGGVNEHYRRLAFEMDDGNKGSFLSGWQCDNPFAIPVLMAVRRRCAEIDYCKYVYFDADENLTEAVLAFHERVDGCRPEAVLTGAGASPLIFAFISLLAKLKVSEVYFIPPVYHTIPVALDRYGISMIPVSEKQPYEETFDLNLPKKSNAVLFMSDPVWYAGTAISNSVIEQIAEWQRNTSAIVFVDGSMQYMPWVGPLREPTSRLVANLTFRLLSPSKQLAIHGYRFAYLLMPESSHPDLVWIYANIYGPASAESVEFAHEAMMAISEQSIPQSLMRLASSRYQHLVDRGIIEADPQPSRGYSVFAKIKAPLPADYLMLDGRFFDQNNYPSLVKVNLLSPSIDLLLGALSLPNDKS